MGLSCVNCRRDLESNQAKFFGDILVCEECYIIATRLCEQAKKELSWLLLMHKELVRNAIVRHELRLSEREPQEEVPKEDLIAALARMAKHARKTGTTCSPQLTPATPSTGSTKLNASSVGGPPSSSSSSDPVSK